MLPLAFCVGDISIASVNLCSIKCFRPRKKWVMNAYTQHFPWRSFGGIYVSILVFHDSVKMFRESLLWVSFACHEFFTLCHKIHILWIWWGVTLMEWMMTHSTCAMTCQILSLLKYTAAYVRWQHLSNIPEEYGHQVHIHLVKQLIVLLIPHFLHLSQQLIDQFFVSVIILTFAVTLCVCVVVCLCMCVCETCLKTRYLKKGKLALPCIW